MPQFSYPGGARPMPWDRNPIARNQSFQSAPTGPHGVTTRWTYTVPANKKALVSEMTVEVQRITVAGADGGPAAAIEVNGVGIVSPLVPTNVALNGQTAIVGCQLYLAPGDVIIGVTGDGSTGGTVEYLLTAAITEFDA